MAEEKMALLDVLSKSEEPSGDVLVEEPRWELRELMVRCRRRNRTPRIDDASPGRTPDSSSARTVSNSILRVQAPAVFLGTVQRVADPHESVKRQRPNRPHG